MARLGGSGKIVSSRNRDQTRSRAPTAFKIQPPIVTHPAKSDNHFYSTAFLAPLPQLYPEALLSPHLGSYRMISLELSWPSYPFGSKVPWPALTPLISPASCLVSQAAVWSIWPQAHELPRVGSLADPALLSAPNSPSHFCRMRARKGKNENSQDARTLNSSILYSPKQATPF